MRIKLDLSDFLEDERKFSVLKVKPKETKTVRDVISKINQLFSVQEEGKLWWGLGCLRGLTLWMYCPFY